MPGKFAYIYIKKGDGTDLRNSFFFPRVWIINTMLKKKEWRISIFALRNGKRSGRK